MALEPGDLIDHGKYRIIRPLARGGFGCVYLAEDLLVRQRVAIKELIPGLFGEESAVRRFIAEARSTSLLRHDRLDGTFNVFSDAGNHYLVMEYMPGGSLDDRLRKGAPLPVEQAVSIALDVAEGLAHVHQHGVIHCDLKPANILFAADGRAKVADFGIAHVPNQMLSRSWLTTGGFGCEHARPDDDSLPGYACHRNRSGIADRNHYRFSDHHGNRLPNTDGYPHPQSCTVTDMDGNGASNYCSGVALRSTCIPGKRGDLVLERTRAVPVG